MTRPRYAGDEHCPWSGTVYANVRRSNREARQRARGTQTARCPSCGGTYALTPHGEIYRHYDHPGHACDGTGRLP